MEIENEKWNCWHLFKDESVTCTATELLHHVSFLKNFKEKYLGKNSPQNWFIMFKLYNRENYIFRSPHLVIHSKNQNDRVY